MEECVTQPLQRLFGSTECRFHAEGREDIDVRMLGCGRPFVVEVRNPRRVSPTPEQAAAAINSAAGDLLEVKGLEPCLASAMAELQRDAECHRKTYGCVCWSEMPLTAAMLAGLEAAAPFEVQQKTPVRVLHRRAPVVRPRMVHWLKTEPLSSQLFRLQVSAQAGTYIKEFVHGDFGRTRPSVRSLLGHRAEILQLDVEELEDEPEEAQEASEEAS